MPISNISPGVISADANGIPERSVTIARDGGRGWALGQTALVWTQDLGRAYTWISAVRTQPSPDQILTSTSPDPGGAQVISWYANCLSVSFSVRVTGSGRASAIATLSRWD
jgi:hypothetical protein